MTPKNSENSAVFIVLKIIALVGLVYLFLVCISLMGAGLKIVGKGMTENFIASSNSAFIGLFIGILATSIVQSSSTTTCIVVGLVGGGLFSLELAIPIVMGANIGTSVTNTIVSFGHMKARQEFRRAYAAAVVHDIFNLLTVILFLPLQMKFNIIGYTAEHMTTLFSNTGGMTLVSPLKLIVKPVVKLIADFIGNGWVCVIVALVLLFTTLRYIVVTLKSLVMQRLSHFFDKVVFRTPLMGVFFGMVLTALVQSSSVSTSLIVPLAGAGIVSLKQVFPYTLGANIGTTITALMASMVTENPAAVSVAFAHLAFNIFGIAVFLPLQRFPIFLATKLSEIASRNRMIPVGIVLLVFFIIPLLLIKVTG